MRPRIVLDTNVWVSGILSPRGAPGQILELILSGGVGLVVTSSIVLEYREVLERPEFGFSIERRKHVLEEIELTAEFVVSSPWPASLPDGDDEMFLAAALAGTADAVVTGNQRHFPAKARGGVKVWSPREFLVWLASIG